MSEKKNNDSQKFIQNKWNSGLYDYCDDLPNCFLTCFCPCVTFGRMAEIVDRGETSSRLGGLLIVAMSHIGCGWYYGSKYRLKIRKQFSLPEEPCSDAVVHFFCCGCALCQEHRELMLRGFDPSLGWQGNVAKHNPQGNTPPIVATGMDR